MNYDSTVQNFTKQLLACALHAIVIASVPFADNIPLEYITELCSGWSVHGVRLLGWHRLHAEFWPLWVITKVHHKHKTAATECHRGNLVVGAFFLALTQHIYITMPVWDLPHLPLGMPNINPRLIFLFQAFVVPAFEIFYRPNSQEVVPFPQSKEELISMWNSKELQPF